ncbi:hypothetical protein TNCV_3771761 [Trichonephila clavipes]|nr:hypothetical protein TNCV_3771761 [Trichonephila clavipes]
MPLRRFRRQYELLSQFERGRIIGMMEAGGWSTGRQLDSSDCVPTASSAAIQAQVALLLASPVSTQPYEGAWLKDIWDRGDHYVCCLEAHPSTPPFGVVLCTRKLYCGERESGHL